MSLTNKSSFSILGNHITLVRVDKIYWKEKNTFDYYLPHLEYATAVIAFLDVFSK